jgi:hypothetical protein
MVKFLKQALYLCFGVIFFQLTVVAQPFTFDKYGYVSDPGFKSFAQNKGYIIVGAFDTVNRSPLKIRAEVLTHDVWGEIDQYGVFIPTKKEDDFGEDQFFETAMHPSGVGDNFKVVEVNGKKGTKHKETGAIGIPIIYDQLKLYDYSIIEISKDNKKGMAYSDGRSILAVEYDTIIPVRGNTSYVYFQTKINGKYGLADSTGKIIFKPEHDFISGVSKRNTYNIFIVRNGENIGLLNKNGKYVPISSEYAFHKIKPEFEHGLISVMKITQNPNYTPGNMWDNSPIGSQELGYLDFNGNTVIKAEYDELEYVEKNVFYFFKGGKYGLMDSNEKVIKYFEYDYVFFVDGFFEVTKNHKKGIIDVDENVLLPIRYDSITNSYDFRNKGYCQVKIGGTRYWVDRYGNRVNQSR